MESMEFFAPFCLPFMAGATVMLALLLYQWGRWLYHLPRHDKTLILRGLPTRKTFGAIGEVIEESLLHRSIWRVDPRLGYMHTSLAFGWFLLITAGWIETVAHVGFRYVPLQGHVFFRYFAAGQFHSPLFDFVMDSLLAVILSGVALAWYKRLRSRALGMRRTTRHTPGDRAALSALWFIFPARLAAESVTCALYGGGGWLTGTVGAGLAAAIPVAALETAQTVAWWFYSLALGLFFVAMPFSRYMHIFTEIPLIFIRRYGVRATETPSSGDRFQIEACSRCGICIDPCQLQSAIGVDTVQSVYFLRDRRYGYLRPETADNCLMCGRCAERCPVHIDLNALRLNARVADRNTPAEERYRYIEGLDRSTGTGRVGYFAGCMTLLTPRTLNAMERIFAAANEPVWWADREGSVCCGRPLKLAGEAAAARKMMQYNIDLFRKHGITTLVTGCPICLRTFREDYRLDGIEVLHHSEYIRRLIREGRLPLAPGTSTFTYHDPCELGRGLGIYDAPRTVIEALGTLLEPANTRQNALCCGSSVANTAISDPQQLDIARTVTAELTQTGAQTIVTACPLCKKALARSTRTPVHDLAEVVAETLRMP